jgi:ribosomal protein S18 acetylase RimI-like enzyme
MYRALRSATMMYTGPGVESDIGSEPFTHPAPNSALSRRANADGSCHRQPDSRRQETLMEDMIDVTRAVAVDQDLAGAMARLVPQLSSYAATLTTDNLQEIVDSPCTALLLARERAGGGRIIGTLTLVIFRIPTGVRAWIEDVVVEASARGKGVGAALSREAIRIATERGARTVDLTSRPSREAANRLYQRLGFAPRDTHVYRYTAARKDSA